MAEYKHMRYYEETLDKYIRLKYSFTVSKTSYSRSIKREGKETIMFNQDGLEDKKQIALINSVRKNARDYLTVNDFLNDKTIHFFDIIEKPSSDKVLVKVDLKSAYWKYAMRTGVILDKTNERFEAYSDGMEVKKAKSMRLKALGSLATTKNITIYDNGIRVRDYSNTELTKQIYMDICRGIDNVMKECIENVEGVCYYYWDCVFVMKEFSEDAVNFFKERDYEVSCGETTLELIRIGEVPYFISSCDDKVYMVRKEYKHLLDH